MLCRTIVDASDFLPTLMELAGSGLPADEMTDGISFAPRLVGKEGPRRTSAFFWYDSRPGWDKETIQPPCVRRQQDYKLFRTGRLFRLTDRPLEEIEVRPLEMTDEDHAAKQQLAKVISNTLEGGDEPPMVNAYGQPEHDLLYLPKDAQETAAITSHLLATGKEIPYGDLEQQQRLWIFNPLDVQDGSSVPASSSFTAEAGAGDRNRWRRNASTCSDWESMRFRFTFVPPLVISLLPIHSRTREWRTDGSSSMAVSTTLMWIAS